MTAEGTGATENASAAQLSIDGGATFAVSGVTIDSDLISIGLGKGAGLYLYPFNRRMFPNPPERVGAERFVFDGPRLGIYADTADPREGPFVNHFINHLEIDLQYLSTMAVRVHLEGSADLARSSVDSYWYRGATSGTWTFAATFVHHFKQVAL